MERLQGTFLWAHLFADLSMLQGLREEGRLRKLQVACATAGSLSLLLWYLRPEPRGAEWPRQRKSPDRNLFLQQPPPTVRQAQHGYQNFPPPFPNGWMFVGPSHLVKKKEVHPLNLWGRDLVLFRGADGQSALLGAYCPHMGTHVGYGGYVKGNSILCPYHEWAFDADGVLNDVPHLDCKDAASYCKSKSNHMRKYPTIEKYGMIFAWMHADEADPAPFFLFDKIEELSLVGPRSRVILGSFHMHVQEPVHNSCDWYHFKTVHSTLGQHWHSRFKMICPEIWSPPSRHKLAKSQDDDGSLIENDYLMITDQFIKGLTVFGFKVPQWIVDRLMNVQVRFLGCMLGSITMKFPLVGTYYGIVQMTPQGVFDTHCEIWGFSEAWKLPNPLCWLLTVAQARTLYQDKEVWEHRTHPKTRNRIKGEYNWKQFDNWVMQCYSPGSMLWNDEDLRW